MKAKIENALNNANVNGFTTPLKGYLKRYIVAFTNNKMQSDNIDISLLDEQATKLAYIKDNVNIWGWQDLSSGINYIDVSTSTDSLDYAINMAKYNNQIAIWDNKEQKEIRVKDIILLTNH